MRPTPWTVPLCLIVLVVIAPPAAAHPSAVPVTFPDGTRCYYYDDHDTNTREVWIEVNGVLEGGIPWPQEWFGVPAGGSGLQREAFFANGEEVPPDFLASPVDLLGQCLV